MKFKVWDKRNERMIEWIDLEFSKDNGKDFITVFEPAGIVRDAIISPILLQSTGLFDKNGVEIYYKDIVRDSYGDVFLIEWLESCFILTESYGDYDHSFLDDLSFYEVVGNQFEHPRLLEEE